jgi:hypothetical protein
MLVFCFTFLLPIVIFLTFNSKRNHNVIKGDINSKFHTGTNVFCMETSLLKLRFKSSFCSKYGFDFAKLLKKKVLHAASMSLTPQFPEKALCLLFKVLRKLNSLKRCSGYVEFRRRTVS